MGNPGAKGKETEFKFRVSSQADLDAVAKAAAAVPGKAVHQENHFFDTTGRRLDKAKYVVRLRQEDSTFFLTVKGPSTSSKDGSLTAKAETEREVSPGEAAQVREGQVSALAVLQAAQLAPEEAVVIEQLSGVLGTEPLVYAGGFSNDRLRLDTALAVNGQTATVTLELDRTTFPGKVVHYEIEVEVPAGVDPEGLATALKALFANAGVETRNGPGKAKRFFAAMRGEPLD
jgi:uncharacterized protein YjbK